MLHALLALSMLAAPGPHKPKIAVLDLVSVTESEAAVGKLLTAVIVSEVSKGNDFEVLSSGDIQGMLSLERQKQLLGCSENSACLAEIGGALGTDYMINGQVGKLGNRYRLDLRLIDSAKSRVLASAGDFFAGNEDTLGDAAVLMTRKLLADGHLRTLDSTVSANEPAGALTATTSSGPSRTPAYVTAGIAGALVVGALLATLETHSTYASAQTCYASGTAASQCQHGDASLKWSGPLADALWVGAIAAGATSTYFFLRPEPSPSGSGGEVGVGGRF